MRLGITKQGVIVAEPKSGDLPFLAAVQEAFNEALEHDEECDCDLCQTLYECYGPGQEGDR